MTELLTKAFEEASKLSSTEQDSIAALVLQELESEQKWDELFAKSGDVMSKLAEEALAEHRAGRTQVLDPDRL